MTEVCLQSRQGVNYLLPSSLRSILDRSERQSSAFIFPLPGRALAGIKLIEIHSKLAHFKVAQYSKPVAGQGREICNFKSEINTYP